jgi:hypothetical protein
LRARMIMEEGFFLDGIDVPCDEPSIDKAPKGALPVLPHTAFAALARFDAAPLGTQKTVYFILFELRVEQGFFHLRLLKDCSA